MIAALLGIPGRLNRILNSGVVRPPSALFASATLANGSLTPSQVAAMLGTAADVSATTAATTLTDLINITSGRGVLLFGAFYSASGDSCHCEVTIDGTVVYNIGASTNNVTRCFAGAIAGWDTTNQRCEVSLESIPYNSSLRVRIRSQIGSVVGAAIRYRPHN